MLNIYANDSASGVNFDIGLMSPGSKQSIKADWVSDTLIRIGCLIHPKMRSYVANINSDNYLPFIFEKKVKNIDFKLEDVDASSNTFIFLIAGMDQIEFTLAVGESKTLSIIKKGKEKGSITVQRN